jgi:hypothetical protein
VDVRPIHATGTAALWERFGDVLVGDDAQPVQQADLVAVVVGQCGHIW